MIALVWQFDVKAGKNDDFEAFYGADGAWTALGRRSRSFLGASFLRDLAMGQRYLVIEYWSEMVVYEKHHADFQDETERLETAAKSDFTPEEARERRNNEFLERSVMLNNLKTRYHFHLD